MNTFIHALGSKAKDIVTGFAGVITYRVEYLTGCSQYGLQPPVNDKGEVPKSEQFDENRIEILDATPILIKEPKAVREKGGPNDLVKTSSKNISH